MIALAPRKISRALSNVILQIPEEVRDTIECIFLPSARSAALSMETRMQIHFRTHHPKVG